MRAVRLGSVLAVALGLACGGPPRPRSDMDSRLRLDGWVELGSPHFSIASGAPRRRTLELARQLEVFAGVVARTTSIQQVTPRLPARIFLFPDRQSYAFFRARPGVAGQMFPSPRGFFMLMSPDLVAARETLFHEYVHFLVHNDSSLHYPLWYGEGIAELLSTLRIRGRYATLGIPPLGAVAAMQRRGPLPSSRVLGARSYSDLGEDLGHFYVHAWALTHYFHAGQHLGHPRRLPQMRDYLGRLDRGEGWREAFAASFGMAPEDFDPELRSYWEKLAEGRYVPRVSLDTRIASELSDADLRELAPEQLAWELGELYLDFSPEHSRYALRMFERALDRAPDHPGALAGRARARVRLGDLDAADADLAQALARAPGDAAVQRAEGDLRAARAAALGDEDPTRARAELGAAREAYRRAIESAPRIPAGYVALGRSYLEEEQEDVSPGIEALGLARGALPWLTELDLDLGRLYLKAGRGAEARAHLEQVLRWSHSEEERDQARELLESLAAEPAPDGG